MPSSPFSGPLSSLPGLWLLYKRPDWPLPSVYFAVLLPLLLGLTFHKSAFWLQEMGISKEALQLSFSCCELITGWCKCIILLPQCFWPVNKSQTPLQFLWSPHPLYLSGITLLHKPSISFHIYLIPVDHRWKFDNCDCIYRVPGFIITQVTTTNGVFVTSIPLRIYFLGSLPLLIPLVWVPPKSDLKARPWIQGIYFRNDPRKYEWGSVEYERGKGENPVDQ